MPLELAVAAHRPRFDRLAHQVLKLDSGRFVHFYHFHLVPQRADQPHQLHELLRVRQIHQVDHIRPVFHILRVPADEMRPLSVFLIPETKQVVSPIISALT